MNEITTTLIGNLTQDPELRFTASGAAVANFTIAVSHRKFDKQQGKSVESATTFARCSAWGSLAESIAESLTRGTRVIAHGSFEQRDFEHNGEKRSSMDFTAEAVGPDLRWATAKVTKAQRASGQAPQQGGFGQQADPWAQQSQQSQQQANAYDEPPF